MATRGDGRACVAALPGRRWVALLVGLAGCVPSGWPLPTTPDSDAGTVDLDCDKAPGTWCPTSADGAPLARFAHTAVWTGTEMIVWGGTTERLGLPPKTPGEYLDTGARYDPRADRWTSVSGVGAPSPRAAHSAIWTGAEMIVWGGQGRRENGVPVALGDGARYDPAMDTWTPVADAPLDGRLNHVAVWTGEEMIVWGGQGAFGPLHDSGGGPSLEGVGAYGDGARYDPSTDAWTMVATDGAPIPRAHAGAVWTGEEMIVWGGAYYEFPTEGTLPDGARYRPADDTWSPMAAYLEDRAVPAMIWTGREVIVWGGASIGPSPIPNGYLFRGDGALYDPATDMWTPMASPGAPQARVPYAVWTGSALVVWGGWAPGQACCHDPVGGGASYDSYQDAWAPFAGGFEPEPRYLATAVWTGTEMVVWGGHGNMELLERDDGTYEFSWRNLGSGGAYYP
jgi:hypothetical protein